MKNNNILRNSLIITLIVFFISRLLFLDRDVPPWDVSFYNALDEFYYTIAGFNKFRFGEFNFQLANYLTIENLRLHNLLQNIFTWLGYSFFGNNYYGLRMGSVIMSFISIIFFWLILRYYFKMNSTIKNTFYLLWLIPLYFVVDYNFVIAGRIAEPTIYRIGILLFLIYVFIKIDKSRFLNILFLGFLSGSSVFFVYINNLFIVPSILCLLLWFNGQSFKKIVKVFLYFSLGLFLSICSYYLIYKNIFNANPFISIGAAIFNYEDRVNLIWLDSIQNILKSFIGNGIKFFSTNIFRHNLLLLILFFSSWPIFILKLKKQKNYVDITIVAFYIFLFFQSLVINDYFFRKQLIQLPLVLFIITASILYVEEFLSFIRKTKYYNYYIIYILFSVLSACLILIYSVRIYIDYSSPIVGINIFTTIVFIIAIAFVFLRRFNIRILISIIFLLVLIPNIFLNYRYIFNKPEYKHRDAMIAAAPLLNGKVIAGGPSHGLRMYNTCIPIFDFWQYERNHSLYTKEFLRLFDDKKIDLSFTYVNKEGRVYESEFLDLSITDLGFREVMLVDINLDHILPDKGIKLGIFEIDKFKP